jgi:hypothetical protein
MTTPCSKGPQCTDPRCASNTSRTYVGYVPADIADQPPPTTNDLPAIWPLVIADCEERHRLGVERYGTPLQPFNGREVLVDAYQEQLDGLAYMRQAIEERRALDARLAQLEADQRAAIDERDRAHAEATSLRRLASFYRSAALCGETLTKGDAEYRAELDGLVAAAEGARVVAPWAPEHIAELRGHLERYPVTEGHKRTELAAFLVRWLPGALMEIDRLRALVAEPFKIIRDQGWAVREEPSEPAAVAYERIRAALADVEVPPGLDKGHPCLDRIAALKAEIRRLYAQAAALEKAGFEANSTLRAERDGLAARMAVMDQERDALYARLAELEARSPGRAHAAAITSELDAAEESLGGALAVLP